MPTYEYSCRDCGEQLEIVQAFTDDALSECPKCGGKLSKVFGSIGISFKGEGFYKTDNRAGGKKPDAAPAKTDSDSSDSKTSSDPKPAEKTETKSPPPSTSSDSGTSAAS